MPTLAQATAHVPRSPAIGPGRVSSPMTRSGKRWPHDWPTSVALSRALGRRGRRPHGAHGCEVPPIVVATHLCANGRFPSVSRFHPPALRLERTIRDLFGLAPVGLPDPRPWLDHSRWGVAAPLGSATSTPDKGAAYSFLPAQGEGLHQIPVGPVHAGIIEPGHFRFHAAGETVVRLEERLGYTHKGVEKLMRAAGRSTRRALSGVSPGTAQSPTPTHSRALQRLRPASRHRRAHYGYAR